MATVPRRWQRRISVLAILLGLIVYVEKADAAPLNDRLAVALYEIAGERFKLDCTYAGRDAMAVAYPRYKQLAPVVYAKPRICRAANAFARTGRVTNETGLALLVLVHEAQHVAGVTSESAAECLALDRVANVADRLHVGTGSRILSYAQVWHDWIVARYAEYAC